MIITTYLDETAVIDMFIEKKSYVAKKGKKMAFLKLTSKPFKRVRY